MLTYNVEVGDLHEAHSGYFFLLAANQFTSLSSAGVDYFRTLEIPMHAGRAFTAARRGGGERIRFVLTAGGTANRSASAVPRHEVRLAGDVKTKGLGMEARPQIYIRLEQSGGVILRTVGDPMSMARKTGARCSGQIDGRIPLAGPFRHVE